MTKQIKRIKFTFPMNETTYNQLKEDSEKMGISMSGYVNYLLATHFANKGDLINSLKEVVEKALNEKTTQDPQR